jgi:hypothetical protein
MCAYDVPYKCVHGLPGSFPNLKVLQSTEKQYSKSKAGKPNDEVGSRRGKQCMYSQNQPDDRKNRHSNLPNFT